MFTTIGQAALVVCKTTLLEPGGVLTHLMNISLYQVISLSSEFYIF